MSVTRRCQDQVAVERAGKAHSVWKNGAAHSMAIGSVRTNQQVGVTGLDGESLRATVTGARVPVKIIVDPVRP